MLDARKVTSEFHSGGSNDNAGQMSEHITAQGSQATTVLFGGLTIPGNIVPIISARKDFVFCNRCGCNHSGFELNKCPHCNKSEFVSLGPASVCLASPWSLASLPSKGGLAWFRLLCRFYASGACVGNTQPVSTMLAKKTVMSLTCVWSASTFSRWAYCVILVCRHQHTRGYSAHRRKRSCTSSLSMSADAKPPICTSTSPQRVSQLLADGTAIGSQA